MVRFMRHTGRVVPSNICGVLAESEIVYPDDRALAEQLLGVRYFSSYGHTEKLVMAAECEHSGDYHVWPTYGIAELLDDEGRPITTPGQRGEIVGTGFINTIVPFI
ncbi:MAG: phenylacetate--CoA ligase family protein, partial [Planctomycetes bacterium]|nr:phenylacetate--CoA ligase family protein [Planctomycetota bacterium]